MASIHRGGGENENKKNRYGSLRMKMKYHDFFAEILRFFVGILAGLLFPLFVVLAQEGSVVPSRDVSSVAPSADVMPIGGSVVSPPRAIESTVSSPIAPLSAEVVPRPTPPLAPIAANATPVIPESPVQKVNFSQESESNLALLGISTLIAAFALVCLVCRMIKTKKAKEDRKDNPHCFDLKKVLDNKLQEITDLKGAVASSVKDVAREKIKEAVQGTSAETILASLEKAEKAYEKLKKLYEECMVEFGEQVFKGIIIENSLKDKSILDKVKIEKRYQSGSWILYNVLVNEEQIVQLSQSMVPGPWYMHFWEPGDDDFRVVFKDTIFTMKSGDTSTWTDALAYGRSIGIPEDQMDFGTR